MPKYTTLIRLDYRAESDLAAKLIANRCAERAEDNLDFGDTAKVIHIADTELAANAEESSAKLEVARDVLIKTGAGDAFEMAQQLNMFAHVLRHHSLADYDYGQVFELADKLRKKEK